MTDLAIRLFRRNPAAGLRHVLTSASYIWCITGPTTLDNYYTVAFVPGEKPKYQKLRDLRGGGPDNVDVGRTASAVAGSGQLDVPQHVALLAARSLPVLDPVCAGHRHAARRIRGLPPF